MEDALEGAAAVAATAVALYATTLLLVRLAGRRTLSQISTFDAVVTIAIGSMLATSIVSDPPMYGRGLVGLLTLLLLQVGVGALRQRSQRWRRLLDFSPRTVVGEQGLDVERGLLGPQLTEEDIEAAVRSAGFRDRDQVALVVLESNGSFSVFGRRELSG